MPFLLPGPEVLAQTLTSALHHVRARSAGNLLAALLLAGFLGPKVGWGGVCGWLGAVAFGLVAAVAVDHAWRRGEIPRARLLRTVTASAVYLGLAWGLVGIVAAPVWDDFMSRGAMLLFFATVSAASALTNGALPKLFVAEIVPMWGLGLPSVLGGGPELELALGLPALFFIGVLAHHNRRLHRQIREMIELRVHNEMLVRELQGEQQLARDAWTQVSRQQAELMLAYDRAHDLASVDTLTGLFNRRRFFEALDSAILALDDGRGCFCVAVLDVDHFKQVNDTHGHGIGDRALQVISGALLSAVRGDDMVARIGGEELAILFQRASLPDATLAAERVRARVAAARLPELPELRLTVSVGVVAGAAGMGSSRVVARADAAMYLAKAAGRDRVVIDADVTAPRVAPTVQASAPTP